MPTTEELYQDQLSVGSPDATTGETQQFVTNPMFADYQQRKADDQAAMDTPANTQPAPAKQPDIAPDNDLMKKIYGTPLPKPELDQARLDRLQKLSRVNTISRGIGVLGDALSLGLGGNVNRRGEDTTTPELARQYQATLDKYKNDKDIYNLRNYQKSIDDAKTEYSMKQAKEANQYKRDILTAKTEQEKRDKEFEFNKWRAEQQSKGISQTETARHNKAMENKKSGSGKSDLPTRIKTKSGKVYDLSPEDASLARDLALQNPEKMKAKYSTFFINEKELDENGDPTGKFVRRLDPRIKDSDLIRAKLEIDEEDKIGADKPTYMWKTPGIPGTQTPAPRPASPVTAPSNMGTSKSTPNPNFDPNKYLRKTSAK